MVNWANIQATYPASFKFITQISSKLGKQADALSLAKSLVAHMRQNGWSYVGGAQQLGDAISSKKINCENLSDLLVGLYAYGNDPNDVIASRVEVCSQNAPVFLPQAKIVHAGLKLDLNVQGAVTGVFFSAGHKVASLNGICYDLISGNKGAMASMNAAYIQCTRTRPAPNDQFSFSYMGQSRHLDIQPGFTSQGLRKYKCT
jgi:hypothetical protein